jgi:hypothetical protein
MAATIAFDHFITWTDAATIDEHVATYRAAGFAAPQRTVRHEPGLRTGFVGFGPEYIEFCWVEDEAAFARGEPEEAAYRAARRPYGLGLVTDDVQALHTRWAEQGYSLPAVWAAAPRDAPPGTDPAWSFQAIPPALLSGSRCFALTYHTRPPATRRAVYPAANSTYAIAGVTFVCAAPAARAGQWRDLLTPGAPIADESGRAVVQIGAHRAVWMTPRAYERTYGWPWVAAPHPCGELAVLHLLATDLARAGTLLERAGRQVRRLREGGADTPVLLVAPDPGDGFVFAIAERPLEDWLRERRARTGEEVTIAQSDPWA